MPHADGSGTTEAAIAALREDVRRIQHDLYHPELGLVAAVQEIRRQVNRVVWEGLGLLVTLVVGLGTIILGVLNR